MRENYISKVRLKIRPEIGQSEAAIKKIEQCEIVVKIAKTEIARCYPCYVSGLVKLSRYHCVTAFYRVYVVKLKVTI